MGFQGLLEIDMKNIPRQFCYWLMTRVLPDGTMVFGQSEVLPLGPAQVRSVLGLPMGAEKVPFDVGEDDEEKVEKMRRIFDLYGVGSNKETISLKKASDALCPLDESGQPIPLADEVDEEDFMVAFLLVALGKVVCTTTNNSNFAKSLLPALTVATEAVKYDWCSLTFEWLCDTANRFHRKFQKDGFRSGCGGSFLFIMIYYLDHLHRVPVQWGVYPRVMVWNSVEVKAALLKDNVSTNEYSKLEGVDIAYGEEHPLVPREDDGNKAVVSGKEVSVDVVVDRVLGHLESKLETIVEGLIGTALTSFVSKMTGTLVDQFVGLQNVGFQNVARRDENAGSTGPRNEKAASTGSRRGGNGWINGHRAEVIPSPKKDGADDDSADRSSPNLEEGPRPNKLSLFDKRILCFVRGWKELKSDTEPGPNLILCDGVDASQRDCYRVVSPRARVGDHYVRVASVLYTKSWASQHTRKRIMMDPSYANFVMVGKDDPKELGQKYGKTFLSYSLDQIQSVFVPVLDASVKNAEHWYCLALDLKAHVVWMIDSLYEDPYLKHDKCHQQLMVALEKLLHLSEPTWEVGTTSTWLRRTFPVRQADNCSCGAIMLSSIKHCARSFEAPYHMEKHTSSLRNILFLEDVNNEFNELHANLEKILPKERRGGRRTGSQMS
ncbi:uncharacterized protein LOC110700456 [Chenopodium quinoa]|nr:uncharacterized protein LOC110700456 [Chenopodium quinoa]